MQTGKKRKADDGEEEEGDERNGSLRKKAKAKGMLPAGFFDVKTNEEVLAAEEQGTAVVFADTQPQPHHSVEASNALPANFDTSASAATSAPAPSKPPIRASTTSYITQPTVDEDEWAAFERDIAQPLPQSPPRNPASSAFTAQADIAAAPMTVEELAAREREAASTQAKERREAEMEGEKEDAARALEEEFDEMDALEARVKRLKEMREKVRAVEGAGDDASDPDEKMEGIELKMILDDYDDEEDYDEFEDWGLR